MELQKNKIIQFQNKLMKGNPLISYDKQTILYATTPIGMTMYKRALMGLPSNNRKIKALPTDIIKCKLCGMTTKRHNQTHHKRTRLCQAYARMNEKIRNLLLN